MVPPRLPLGDAYSGECRAANEPFQPDATQVREVCNLGYGRGRCTRFPAEAPDDAVRFHILEDRGERIRIQFVFEKDCWPRTHGVLECSGAPGGTPAAADNTILDKQANAFVTSYLRRRS